MQQAFAQRRQLRGDRSAQLTQRQIFLCFALRGDEVCDGLRTGKIHLPIEKGSTGELTGFGRLATGIDQPFEQGLLDIQTTMASYFHRIFSGKGMRGTKNRTKHFVKDVGCTLNTTKMDRIWFRLRERMVRMKKRVHDRDSLRATHADECNTSHTIGARYSANRGHRHQIERKDNTFFLHTQKN